jgi:lipoyl(octanoyl) transferase
MRAFTEARGPETADEIWLTEHESVYTVGLAGRNEHLPRGDDARIRHIALRRIDRGGQITYHGPGQAVVYVMVDLGRRNLGIRRLVSLLEQAVIEFLGRYNVEALRKPGAPGVYVNGAKIAALGLRVRRGATYHGLAFNVDMDLSPFLAIDPCGFPGQPVTDARTLGIDADVTSVSVAIGGLIRDLLEPAR